MAECVKKKAVVQSNNFKAGDVVRVKKSISDKDPGLEILLLVNDLGVAKFNKERYNLDDGAGINCTGLYHGAQSYTWEPAKLEFVCSASELTFNGKK